MSFLKNLFGQKPKNKPATKDESNDNINHETVPKGDEESFESVLAAIPDKAKSLIQAASQNYPNKDPRKALELFLQGLEYVGKAEGSRERLENIDISDIGYAIWGAWVCMDLLDKSEEEINQLFEIAKAKSPVTLERIHDRLNEVEVERETTIRMEKASRVLISSPGESKETILQAAIDLKKACNEEGAWWKLRDLAISMYKDGMHESGWDLLNESLDIAKKKGGNIPSIYVAMGDFRKAEDDHADAARMYLMSCVNSRGDYLKRAVDQLRISLKKAGIEGDATLERDELLGCIGKMEPQNLITKLNGFIEKKK